METGVNNNLNTRNRNRNEFKNYNEMDTKSFIFRLENICRDNGLQHNKDGEPTVLNIILELVFYQLFSPTKTDNGYDLDNYLFKEEFEELSDPDNINRFHEEYYLCNLSKDNIPFYKKELDLIYQDNRSLIQYSILKDIDKVYDEDKIIYYIYRFGIRTLLNHNGMFSTEFALNKNNYQKGFDEKIYRCFAKIIEHLKKNIIKYDDVGDIFEYFNNTKQEHSSKSKSLGQYFTPKPIIDKLIENINIHDNVKILDYACGSGALLMNCYKKNKNIEMFGCDVNSYAYKFLQLNHLFTTLKTVNVDFFQCADALHYVPRMTEKMDIVIANPPFGIDVNILSGNIYEVDEESSSSSRRVKRTLKKLYGVVNEPTLNLTKKLDKKMTENNSCTYDSEGVFLSLAISALKEGGQAAIVFSTGILDSDTNVFYRKLLLETCILNKVIHVSGGKFKNTSIATCLLIFTKGKSTINYEILHEDFETGNTINKQWVNDVVNDEKYLLIGKKQKQNLSENKNNDIFIEYKLGEICYFKNGKGLKKSDFVDGDILVIGGGIKPIGYHNEYNTYENTILCSSSGTAGYISRYNLKVWASDCFKIIVFPVIINVDYDFLYYQIKFKQDYIMSLKKGNKGPPHVYSKDISDLIIKIPTIELQRKLVELFETKYKTEELQKFVMKIFLDGLSFEDIEEKLKVVYKFISIRKSYQTLKKNKQFEMNSLFQCLIDTMECNEYKLGDVCEFKNGQNITKDELVEGPYLVYGGGIKPVGYHNKFNLDKDNIIVAKDGVYSGFVHFNKTETFVTGHGYRIFIKNESLTYKLFIYYTLKYYQSYFYTTQKGGGKGTPRIDLPTIYNLSIKVPSLENQQLIIDEMELLDNQSKSYDKLIERQNKLINDYVNGNQEYQEKFYEIYRYLFNKDDNDEEFQELDEDD